MPPKTPAPRDEAWHPARLIPVSNIKGQEEQERRATSALLAVIGAVPEFGHALLGPLGAPRGRIRTFAEVQLRDGEGKLSTPDGAIVVERGTKRWTALVEVKTGRAELASEQVGRYLEWARNESFAGVLTISNQITGGSNESPIAVDKRRLRGIGMWHLSWWRIVTEAVLQHRFRGISDPDQAWILGELIAYLDHENSGASGFTDMGERWIRVRDGARAGTLRAADPELRVVAERWEHFLDYLALGLAQDLGRDVTPVRPRGQSTQASVDALVQEVASGRPLVGALRVPDTVGPLSVLVDLRARQVTTAVSFPAPSDGRATARLNWLLRQVPEQLPGLRIEAAFPSSRETTSLLAREATEFPQRLLHPSDPKRPPREFTLALTSAMGLKRGKAQGSFVRETRRQVLDFYRDVVQDLKPWQPRAPKLPDPPQSVPTAPQPEPPPFVAVDDRNLGEAQSPGES